MELCHICFLYGPSTNDILFCLMLKITDDISQFVVFSTYTPDIREKMNFTVHFSMKFKNMEIILFLLFVVNFFVIVYSSLVKGKCSACPSILLAV